MHFHVNHLAVVPIGLYLLVLLGLLIIFFRPIKMLFKFIQFQNSYKLNVSVLKKSKLIAHLDHVLVTVVGEKAEGLGHYMLIAMGAVFSILVIVLSKSMPMLNMLLYATLFSLFPYFLLRIKLYTLRIEGSYEGEFLISELMNQYKLNHFNMIEAIESTVKNLEKSPRTQRLLFRMSIRLKVYKDELELEAILNEFVYGIETQWSRLLVNNMHLAIDSGLDVTSGLDDVLNELRRAKKAYEKSTRNTAEGFVIVKYLIPALYIGSIVVANKYFDFSLGTFFHYQLFTAAGLKLFVMNLGLYMTNLTFMTLFKQRKFDLA